MIENPHGYAGQVRAALREIGQGTRADIRRTLAHIDGRVVDAAIDGLIRKRKLTRHKTPVVCADGSRRMFDVYGLRG